MVILNCTSESGDKYTFKAKHIPSAEEFNSFCKENYLDEYDEENDYNYISIDNILKIEDINEIKLKD